MVFLQKKNEASGIILVKKMKKNQATIKDIAHQLGISFSTVSRALHNNSRIGVKTRELVHAKAAELNYVPNPVANFLKNNKTYSIGVLVPNLHEEFFVEIIEGIEQIIEPLGYHVVIMQSKESLDKEKNALNSFLKMHVDGLLASISEETSQIPHFQKLENHGIPIIFFDRVPVTEMAHKVKCNMSVGALKTIDHLVGLGKRRIAFIAGPEQLETSAERLDGYKEGLKKNNIGLDEDLIIHSNLDHTSVEKALDKLLKLKSTPDAILSFNDLTAVYLMKYYNRKYAAKLPNIIFTGFGNIPFLKFMDKPIPVTVEQYPLQMGITAAKLLMQCIDNEDDKPPYQLITLSSNLVFNH